MKMIALAYGCLLLLAVEVRAQDLPKDLNSLPLLSEPLPDGNLVFKTPDDFHWTLSSVAIANDAPPTPGAAAPKPSVMGTVSVNKAGKTYQVESVDSSGNKTTRWKNGSFQATDLPGAASPLISYDPESSYYIDFSKTDFPEFAWISPKRYVGMAKLGTTMAMVFKGKVATRGPQMAFLSMAHRSHSEVIALIDLETRKPLMLQVDSEILLYQFPGGTGEVSIPPEVQRTFDAMKKQLQRASLVSPG